MPNSLDQFPVNDPILMNPGSMYMSQIWKDFIAMFQQNLSAYLAQTGIFVPRLTSTQRDTIQSPSVGQLIYNTTLDELQVYKSTGWTTV
jgi:hypothetical protein